LGLASSSGFSCSGAAMSEPSPPIFIQLVRPGLGSEVTIARHAAARRVYRNH
jgi:hypothetical protein